MYKSFMYSSASLVVPKTVTIKTYTQNIHTVEDIQKLRVYFCVRLVVPKTVSIKT